MEIKPEQTHVAQLVLKKKSGSFCQVAELRKKVASDSEVYGMIRAHYMHEAHQQQIGEFQRIQWVVIAGFCSLMMLVFRDHQLQNLQGLLLLKLMIA